MHIIPMIIRQSTNKSNVSFYNLCLFLISEQLFSKVSFIFCKVTEQTIRFDQIPSKYQYKYFNLYSQYYITKMYPEIVQSKSFLPRRHTRNVGSFNNSESRQFITNYYNVQLHPSLAKVFMYEAKFPPEIPADSSQLIARCIYQLIPSLRASIGFICFTGKILYGYKQKKQSETLQAKIQGNPIQLHVRYTKELDVNELINNPKTRPSIFHFLNSKLKSCLRTANICELGKRGQFYQKDQLLQGAKKEMQQEYYHLERAGMNVLRGYKFTLLLVNKRLKLQLDVCSRVLQKNNLCQDFSDFVGTREELQMHFKDATVITRYGNYRTYKIQQIDFSLGPTSTFKKGNQDISYLQYFKKYYNADIYNLKQPLIKVLAQVKKQLNKSQFMNIQRQYVYLVPELVSLTGMKQQQRANFQSMKALSPFTKLQPNDRFNQSSKVLVTLNRAKDILEVGQQQYMKGYQLLQPKIMFRQIANIRGGAITNRGQLYKPHLFTHWVYAYSKCNPQDFHEAVSAENYLRQASQAYGIQYKQPIYIEIQPQNRPVCAEDFCQRIKKVVLSSNNKFELILIILKPKQVHFYGLIKDKLTNELGIPCQVMQSRTLNKGKGILSIASKIAIQMSCKAGDAPWIVQQTVPYFKNKNFAYSAISSSKGKGGYTISFVGTTNNSCTQVYSSYILKIAKKQKIDGIHLMKWFIGWIKSYFLKNKVLPETLILFRQSVGSSLLKPVLEYEIDCLKNSINEVKKRTKTATYDPEIIYIVVNKQINSRFFGIDQNKLFNPQPGSIIVQQMSTDDQFDFHLVAQKVTQGTCTPTHYIVAYDSSSIPQQDLIRFTYEQCYNYYNWQGSVKVPACLQCSNKLSKLAGESIQKPFADSKISQTYFFL